MKNLLKSSLPIGLILITACFSCTGAASKSEKGTEMESTTLTRAEADLLTYILPSPQTEGEMSVEQALANRRSQRRFLDEELTTEQLSQILWAAYGVTRPIPEREFMRGGLRTAPSAGALYPFDIYVAVGNVIGIEKGLYKYVSEEHKIVRIMEKDIREELCAASWGQKMLQDAPVSVIYTAIFSRMTGKYGERGRERYVCMDLGHSAQNIYLQAEALNLGTCAVGAFEDEKLIKLLQLPEEEEPLYIMPVGYYEK